MSCAQHTGSGTPPSSSGVSLLNGYAAISGSGSADIGVVDIQNNEGTIQIEQNTYPSYVYTLVDWSEFNQTIYQGIAADNSHFFVFFIYCNRQNQIDSIYWEGMNGPQMTLESGSGVCNYAPTGGWPPPSPHMQAAFANINFQNMIPSSLTTEFSISGTNLNYTPGSPGTFSTEFLGDVSTSNFNVYPFGTVDCSSGCGSPGWYEMHSLFLDPASQKACFGVIYLLTNEQVPETDYWICFPNLTQPFPPSVDLTTSWTKH